MKSAIRIAAVLVALAVTPSARGGGTIDATQYLPVGAFNAWEMIDKALWADGLGVKDESQIIEIGKVSVIQGVPRYNVRTPFFQDVADIILQFGTDGGVLYLYGVRVVDGADLGEDDLSVPTMVFDDPVPVGDTTTQLDVNFAITPVTAKIVVSIDLGFDEVSGTVFVDGTITSRWNTAPAINTPLGVLGDDETVAELVITADLTYSSPDSDINDELMGEETHKSVSGVMGPGVGFVQIDGKGSQQKIVNRVILPGDLVSNPLEPDAFPDVPPGDLASFSLDILDVVSLEDAVSIVADGGITDGNLTLDDPLLEHALGGALLLTAQVSSDAGDDPVDLELKGTAKINAKTGGLKVKLNGKTKKLDLFEAETFGKLVKFSVNQEILPPFDPTDLVITWTGGKDPETKELSTGTLLLPVTPFIGGTVDVVVNLPVDVPKVKAGLLFINPAKRQLGAEGVLTLGGLVADGSSKAFPVTLRETATVAEGLPTVRTYKLTQTGKTLKVFSLGATSTGIPDFTLTKLTGKILGVKIAPLLEEVVVGAQ